MDIVDPTESREMATIAPLVQPTNTLYQLDPAKRMTGGHTRWVNPINMFLHQVTASQPHTLNNNRASPSPPAETL